MSEIKEMRRLTGSAKLHLVSGLHVGAGNDRIEIGGIDNPVLKHPHTNEPYIPGSSIKGRVRFLLEWAFGKVRQDGKPWGSESNKENSASDPADPILRIFGNALKEWRGGPTRLLLRDCPLDVAWLNRTLDAGLPLTEEKTEVVINRIEGKAHAIGPRTTERVPAGAIFDFAFAFRLYDTGDAGKHDQDCFNWFLAGLSLLEEDALGGSGSRGYGRIRFENLEVNNQRLDNRFRINPFDPTTAPDIYSF